METIVKFVLVMFVLEAIIFTVVMSTVRNDQIEWCSQHNGEMVGGTCYYSIDVGPLESG